MIIVISFFIFGVLLMCFGVACLCEKNKWGWGVLFIAGVVFYLSFILLDMKYEEKFEKKNRKIFQETCKDYLNNKIKYDVEGRYRDTTFVATDTLFYYTP